MCESSWDKVQSTVRKTIGTPRVKARTTPQAGRTVLQLFALGDSVGVPMGCGAVHGAGGCDARGALRCVACWARSRWAGHAPGRSSGAEATGAPPPRHGFLVGEQKVVFSGVFTTVQLYRYTRSVANPPGIDRPEGVNKAEGCAAHGRSSVPKKFRKTWRLWARAARTESEMGEVVHVCISDLHRYPRL